ncbi:MAG TPA: ABC transporter permease [Actinospica sp.]|nr:ABC transporter permease [Actinospica sp.]
MTTAATLNTVEVAKKDHSKLVGGVAQVVVGAFGLWAFGTGPRTSAAAHTVFGFKDSAGNGPGQLSVPSAGFAIGLAVVAILCGLVRAFAPISRRTQTILNIVFVVAFVLSFLVWGAAGNSSGLPVPSIVALTATSSVPFVLGSLSGLLSERSGVVNIAIEGQFLAGAFAGALTASVTGSVWAGLIAGCAAGALISSLLAVLANRYLIEQVVLGVVINLLCSGLTGFFYDRLMANNGTEYNTPPTFSPIRIPGLASVPIIGPLFDQNIVFYAAYLLVPAIWFALYRTRWGLRTRAVGEHPVAADTVGIKVLGLRYWNLLLAGLLSGLGGVWLTIGLTGPFGKDMSDGKGYIALAALIVGRWTPVGSMGAALLFGFATELQLVLSSQGTPIPSQFLQMIPYLVTVFLVAVIGGVVRPPAAENKPFVKG